jgi:2-amino-4-hydroxy-6-hydroxymethyldihydropteridine diphosphokinase
MSDSAGGGSAARASDAPRSLRAGIGLGSNLGNRLAQLRAARSAIQQLPAVSAPFKASPLYETEPVQTEPGAGAFLNAVLEVGYSGEPLELLAALHQIEGQLGRAAERARNASRTIDLDLLYVGDVVLTTAAAVVPHPRMHLRRFVLAPLAEIRPELRLPGRQHTIAELLATLDDSAGARLYSGSW